MILAVIQARMASSRLPGKVMRNILTKPLIGHMLQRLRRCRKIDDWVVATSKDVANDPLCSYLSSLGKNIFRGSENDVLDRFYQAARPFQPSAVVRLTADCPLIEPEICDSIVGAYLERKVDYMHTSSGFAEGLDCEIFSFDALERAWKEAKLKSEREHVTLYFNNHPELFSKSVLENTTDDSRYRFTVDEPADLKVVTAVFEHFDSLGREFFGSCEIKEFLDQHPEISRINSGIIRNEGLKKSLAQDCEVGFEGK